MNSFSMCSLHRMQSFRSGLLQCGSPTGHRSCHKTCQGLQLNLGHIPGPQHGASSMAAVWIPALSWSSVGCRGANRATMVFMACREISTPAPVASSPSLSSLTLVPARQCFAFSHSPLTAAAQHFFTPP